MARFKTLDDLDARGKRVLVRVDFNVPMQDGEVTDATRIERGSTTIKELMKAGAKTIVLAHFGRPKGRVESSMSLAPIARALESVLGTKVAFASDSIGAPAETVVAGMKDGDVVMLENLRFHAEEEKNDPAFADALAKLGDAYVNDAFSASHRAHASITGLAERLPAYAGRLMQAELEALGSALEHAERPTAALIGGAKVSTKLDVLGNLLAKVDVLVIGGGMANTFLNAKGLPVGKSLCEHDLAAQAKEILAEGERKGVDIVLPVDAVVAPKLEPGAKTRVVAVADVGPEDMILDIGPASVAAIGERLARCKTLLWNGPLGAFEIEPFDAGTNAVAREVAGLSRAGRMTTVAGGGDTVAALVHAGVLDDFTYVSTAGGAFLEWLEGKDLPGVTALYRAT
ncbi:MAG: phosphoglycerate kinase [Geminicoccaceae bacterium]